VKQPVDDSSAAARRFKFVGERARGRNAAKVGRKHDGDAEHDCRGAEREDVPLAPFEPEPCAAVERKGCQSASRGSPAKRIAPTLRPAAWPSDGESTVLRLTMRNSISTCFFDFSDSRMLKS